MKMIRILFLLILISLVSGCSSNYINTSFQNKIIKADTNEYQYSAPWDKDLYDSFYNASQIINVRKKIKGGIVPHHLVAGFMPATFFNSLQKQKPSVIVLIGPNHFSRGQGKVITTMRDWKTIYGVVKTDTNLVKKLSSLFVEEDVIAEEHSVYSLIPFIFAT